MEEIRQVLSQSYWHNTIQDYIIALSIVVLGIAMMRLFKRHLLVRLRHWASLTETNFDDVIVRGVDRFILPIVTYLFVYWGITYLEISAKTERLVSIVTSVVVAFFVIRLLSSSVKLALEKHIRKQENGETKVRQITGLMILINAVIWVLGTVFLFSNLGYDVSALLAGVGIGGVAIALAAQNIIGDLFNYFVIFFDKPFEVGDAINVDDKNGTIEYIGLKTTRLRSLTGEQIIIANSDLTKSRVHNFKRQETRRIQFLVTVNFRTPTEKLNRIPKIVREIILETPDTKFDRAHFARFTEYGLVFEVVYFVTVADYLRYMDIQQSINIQIMESFQQEKIDFLIREDRPGAWDNPETS